MKACRLMFITATTLFIGLPSAVRLAAQDVQAKVSAESGEAFAASARDVVLDQLPQITPSHSVKPMEAPLRDAVIKAASQPGVEPNDVSNIPPSPTPSISRMDTPGTTKVFLPPHAGDESSCGFFIPSDQALATTPSYVVQVINICINVLNATSGVAFTGFPKSLAAFCGVAVTDNLSDPRAFYDPANSRFVVEATDFTTGSFCLAASTTANPTSTWHVYILASTLTGTGCPDYPMMGQTENEIHDTKGAIYLSWDRFNCASGAFVDDVVWDLPKTPIYSGAAFGFNFFFNLRVGSTTVDHVQPANVVSRADRPRAEFLLNTFNFNSGCGAPGCNGLVVWAISDGVGPAKALAGVQISTPHNYVQPVTIAQSGAASGTTCALNPGFVGITGTVNWSAGDLYAATTTRALNGQASNGWEYWQIHPYLSSAGNFTGVPAPVIRNEICWGCNGFSGDGTYSEFYPTVQPDDEGNVTVVFNFSSSSTHPSLAYVSQRTTQATGSFPDGGNNLVNGAAFYCQLDSFGRNRWGDETATSAFGTAVSTLPQFWFAGQFAESNGNWGTAIARNAYTALTQP